MFSFHSPDTTFNNPYINANEIKIYTENQGKGEGHISEVYNHPRHKQLDAIANRLRLLSEEKGHLNEGILDINVCHTGQISRFMIDKILDNKNIEVRKCTI
jgi:hypothetical protein